MPPFPPEFFARPTRKVARDLLGAHLVYDHPGGGRLAARIVETEAYLQDDPAFRGWGVFDVGAGLVRPEGRAEELFGPPGRAYVYRCYGSWLLNVVTRPEGVAGCILIRAAEPLDGHEAMWQRRAAARTTRDLTNGPGKLCQAFDLDGRHHRQPLTAPPLYLAPPENAEPFSIETTARIGLNFGVDLPYRYFIAGNPFVSPGTPSDVAAARRRAR